VRNEIIGAIGLLKSTSAPTGKMRRIAKRLSGDLASVGALLSLRQSSFVSGVCLSGGA
jgi:hypothetical protein